MRHKADDTHILKFHTAGWEKTLDPICCWLHWSGSSTEAVACLEYFLVLNQRRILIGTTARSSVIERRTGMGMGYMIAYIYISKPVYLWLKHMIK